MLSFEITRSGKTIEIICDQQGLDLLITTLGTLRNTADHIHLCAPRELSNVTPTGGAAVPEVIITTGGD
jgi:hypothetical protein